MDSENNLPLILQALNVIVLAYFKEPSMSRVCYFTGKKPRMGKKIARRGIAKKAGGIGLKTTGITRRRFLPNLQSVKIIDENGRVRRVKVSANYLKTGRVVRAPKRNWKRTASSTNPPAQAAANESR